MSNFIFSLNATMPVFLIILLGWFLGRIHLLTDEFIKVSNRFVYVVLMPMLLFKDIASSNVHSDFDLRFLLFCMISTTICFFTIWGGAKLFIRDRSMTAAFVQASFRGSAAILGVAFIQNMYGNAGMAPFMIIGCVPLFNIYSIIVLSTEGEGQGHNGIKETVLNVLKNPIILGIVLGIIGSLLGIYEKLPKILVTSIGSLSNIATPLALLTIGAGFEGRKAIKKWKPTLCSTIIKLVVQPLIFLPIAIAMGYRQEHLIALLVMLGAPTTVSCYIMAVNMKQDGVLTSSIVVLSTLLASVTMTIFIYALKVLGYL